MMAAKVGARGEIGRAETNYANSDPSASTLGHASLAYLVRVLGVAPWAVFRFEQLFRFAHAITHRPTQQCFLGQV